MGVIRIRGLPIFVKASFLLLVATEPTVAQPQPPTVFDGAAAARWIAHPAASADAFGVFHFRRVFDLEAVPETFVVHISADNRYRLSLNETPVSSGPQRSDLRHWRYETVDLAPQLRAGRNVLAATVWNWGAARPVAQFSHRTAFLLQANGMEETVLNTGPESAPGAHPPAAGERRRKTKKSTSSVTGPSPV